MSKDRQRAACVERRVRGLFVATVLCVYALHAHGGSERRNWFDDPFFQISAAIPDCPVPAGPYLDETERRVQAHSRAERGTTCWLSGQCDRPNFYAYDKDIAEALRAALRQRNPFADSTLWVTVQGRIVYFEGCVADERIAPDLEAFARSATNVQQAVALVFANPAVPPPYKLLSAP